MERYPKQLWMNDRQYDMYCTFCILAEHYTQALKRKDRKAFLMLSRIMKHLDAYWQ